MFGFWLMNELIEKIYSLVQKEYIFLHKRYTLFRGKIYSFLSFAAATAAAFLPCRVFFVFLQRKTNYITTVNNLNNSN